MTYDEAKQALVVIYMEKAQTALASMRQVMVKDPNLAVNRAYYACFYATSAVLLKQRRQFVKHKGVKAALHQHLVKPKILPAEFGSVYDKLFLARGEADYLVEKQFTLTEATEYADQAERFVEAIKPLLER